MNTTTSTPDDRLAVRIRRADFGTWRDKVTAVRGCARPIHLTGSSTILATPQANPFPLSPTTKAQALAHRSGHIFVPCGTRRASVCPACADRYAADAFHLMHSGLAGDEGKGVPASVTAKPRQFVTLTAPSFGTVHGRRTSRRGRQIPCPCGEFHHPDDPRLGTAVNPDAYDYEGAVLWQAHAGVLWHRFVITLRRHLARAGKLSEAALNAQLRVSYAKVAEYQRRGLVHFHAVIRIDGHEGAHDPTPKWVTHELVAGCVRSAAAAVLVESWRPCGTVLPLTWGSQVDVREIRPDQAGQFEDQAGQVSETKLAGYIAKYATKSTGSTVDGIDRRLLSQAAIDMLTGITEHHRRMIQTAWDLGGLEMYNDPKDGLKLRRWAHMLGFRGHFLTKSRRYSTTFREIRHAQAAFRRTETLAALGIEDDEGVEYTGLDGSTIYVTPTALVVNTWNFVSVGYDSDEERELAAAIAEGMRQSTHEGGAG